MHCLEKKKAHEIQTYDAWDQPQRCNLRDSIIVHFEETASNNKKTLIRGKKSFHKFLINDVGLCSQEHRISAIKKRTL